MANNEEQMEMDVRILVNGLATNLPHSSPLELQALPKAQRSSEYFKICI
jgi:hypothetical protein